MGQLYFLDQPPPVEYTVRVSHHFNGQVEVIVEGVGSSKEDRQKVSRILLEAAALVESGPEPEAI